MNAKIARFIRTLPILACLLAPGLRAQTTDYSTSLSEFTIGGGGIANKDLNSSLGALNFSIGHFTSPAFEIVFRQGINYSNPENSPSIWNAASRVAFDLHLSENAVRPFIGINVGGVYGEGVSDSWAAGLEAGLKFTIQPRSFIFVMADYAWLSSRIRNLDDRFGDGQFSWTTGVGFRY